MYIVKKVIKKMDGTTTTEHLGFVTTPEEFNSYIFNNYHKDGFAMTPPDIKTFGMGSKAITIVDMEKIKCPIVDGAIFTIVSIQDKKLV